MMSSERGNNRWGSWRPKLFLYFDPAQTYLAEQRPEFTDRGGDTIFDPDTAQELLLLGYAAMLEIGDGKVPNYQTWGQVCDETCAILWQSSEVFDWQVYAQKVTQRLDVLDWGTSRDGSLEIVFLHDDLLRRQEKRAWSSTDAIAWSMLCLMWIDRAVYSLDGREATHAVDEVLRASAALVEAKPRLTRAEVRSELARAAARKKLELDPTQRIKLAARAIWRERRGDFKSKAALARHIMDTFPDLQNQNVVTRWIREWERELETGTQPAE